MPPYTATILCVDDEDNQLMVRKLLLESAGYRVFTAKSGVKALEIFDANASIDMAIVDYWMAEMNGVALAEQLKQRKPSLRVVILSAFGELPGESLGIAELWLRKGLPPAELLKAIAILLPNVSSQA